MRFIQGLWETKTPLEDYIPDLITLSHSAEAADLKLPGVLDSLLGAPPQLQYAPRQCQAPAPNPLAQFCSTYTKEEAAIAKESAHTCMIWSWLGPRPCLWPGLRQPLAEHTSGHTFRREKNWSRAETSTVRAYVLYNIQEGERLTPGQRQPLPEHVYCAHLMGSTASSVVGHQPFWPQFNL